MNRLPIWVLPLVFLAASVPTVLLLQAMATGGDFKIIVAMAAGALATGLVQSRWAARERSRGEQQ